MCFLQVNESCRRPSWGWPSDPFIVLLFFFFLVNSCRSGVNIDARHLGEHTRIKTYCSFVQFPTLSHEKPNRMKLQTTSKCSIASLIPMNSATRIVPSSSKRILQHTARIPPSTFCKFASSTPSCPRQRGHLHVVAAVKKSSSRNVACSKTLIALPGAETTVEALCQKVVEFSKERASDRSSGLLAFDCSKVGPSSLYFLYRS